MRVARAYADALCTSAESRGVGVELEAQYDETIAAVLRVTAHAQLSEAAPQLQRLIRARAAHITILNLMQARAEGGGTPAALPCLVSGRPRRAPRAGGGAQAAAAGARERAAARRAAGEHQRHRGRHAQHGVRGRPQ